jgi:UDP-N-acetylglucosamine 2-epimerase (non-hydrolysing)
VGTDEDRIVEESERVLRGTSDLASAARGTNPYGDGHASERIASILDDSRYDPFEPASAGAAVVQPG